MYRIVTRTINISICIIIFLLYFLPFLVLSDEIYIHVHDNLDSIFLYAHHLANSGHIFNLKSDIIFENVMNGLPASYLPSSLFTVLLFWLFGSLAGYIINDIMVHSIGFIGMFILLKKFFIPEPQKRYIIVVISLLFALIPFETMFGASVSGQPMLLYAFLNILNKKPESMNYILILLFPFYSWLALSGIFIVISLIMILIVDAIKNKKINSYFFWGIFIFIVSYCVVEYSMLYDFLFRKSFILHRSEWDLLKLGIPTLISSIKKAGFLILQTQYHTGAFKTYAVILAFFIALATIQWRRSRLKPILWLLPLMIVVICLFYGFYRYLVWYVGVGSLFPIFKIVKLDRFYFFLPLLWFLLFSISLNEISSFKKGKWCIPFLIIFHLVIAGYTHEYKINAARMVLDVIPGTNYDNFIYSREKKCRLILKGFSQRIYFQKLGTTLINRNTLTEW